MYISRQLLFLIIFTFLVGYYTPGWLGIFPGVLRPGNRTGSGIFRTHYGQGCPDRCQL